MKYNKANISESFIGNNKDKDFFVLFLRLVID